MRRWWWLVLVPVAALLGFAVALLAPVEPGNPKTVDYVVIPGEGLGEIAGNLEQIGLIRQRHAFMVLARIRGQARRIQAGPYRASSGEWAWQVLGRMVDGDFQDTTVTVPEGLWMTEVADVVAPLVAGGVDSFLAAAGDSALMAQLGVPAERAEGYLFPSTYRLIPGTPARSLVRQMVRTFMQVWQTELADTAQARGIRMHDLVTVASIVEAEAQVDPERPRIAAVYWNRLEADYPLQADPTVIYGIGERRSRTLYADLEDPSPYNTYRNPGLPPGPIGNPGRAALLATLWPTPGCRDLFFVATGDGTHLFAPDYQGHLRNRRLIRQNRRPRRARRRTRT